MRFFNRIRFLTPTTSPSFNPRSVPTYIDASSATKPTDASVVTGSMYYETDTENWFIFDGTTWKSYSGALSGTAAVTIADGANAALGTRTNTPTTGIASITAASVISILKGIFNRWIGAPNFATSQVSITSSAGGGSLIIPHATSKRIIIRNLDVSNPVYWSDNAVPTTGNGFPLKAGESITFETLQQIYAIATGSAVTVAIHEEWY